MTEQDLWIRLRKAAHEMELFAERIENAGSFGTFDTNIARNNVTFWVEFKRTVHDELLISQLNWARRRWRVGCAEDMWVIFYAKNAVGLHPILPVLENGGKLSMNHAMVFSSMGDVVLFLKRSMEKIHERTYSVVRASGFQPFS